MREKENTEARRLVTARETLKVVWVAYRDHREYIDACDGDVCVALEVALDEIDIALLRLDNVDIRFEYRGDTNGT